MGYSDDILADTPAADVAADIAAVLTAVGTRLAAAGYTAPDNAGVAAIKAKTDSLTFTTAGKVDAKLASDGLDNIAATAPTALATTFAGKVLQIWERFFGKVVKDDGAGTIKHMQGTGSTAQTTQTFTSASGVETQDKAT